MPAKGRGRHPLRSTWLGRGRGRGRGLASPVGKQILPSGAARVGHEVYSDWFFPETELKLYLRNTTTNGISIGGVACYDLLTTAGASADTAVVNTTAAGTEIQFTKTAGGSVAAFITGRVPAGGWTITFSDVALWLQESASTVNAGLRFRLFKYSGGTETELGGSPFDAGTEFNTGSTLTTLVGNVTDTALAENDRLLLRIYAVNVGTMAAGTATINFNGASGASTVAFDAVASATGFGGANPASPITWSHTCTGTNRYLEVDIFVGAVTAPDSDIAVTAVTYNGVAMTLVPGSLIHSNAGTRGYVVKYGLVNPASGSNTVSVSYTNSSVQALDVFGCNSRSYTGVNQTTPYSNLASATGSGTSATVNVTSAAGSMVSAAFDGGSSFSSTNQTQHWIYNVNPNSAGGNGAGNTAAGATSVTMSGTCGADEWAVVAYSIDPTPAADSYINVYPSVTFKAESSGVTGTGSTSQAQTASGSGTHTVAAVTGTGATSQAQTSDGAGTHTIGTVDGTGATSQAQTASGSGTHTVAAVSGTGSTSQAQTASGSGLFGSGVDGTGTTSQAQTSDGSGTFTLAAVTGSGSTSQAQTSSGSGSHTIATVTGTGSTSQAQTADGSGLFTAAGVVNGTGATSQAQTSDGSGVHVAPVAPVSEIRGGGIDHQHKRRKATLRDKPNQHLDAIIAQSFKEVFEKLTDKKAPKTVQKKANKIVSEYTEEYRPKFDEIDWFAFNQDLEAVQRLFALYHREIADARQTAENKRIFDIIENDNLEFLLMH